MTDTVTVTSYISRLRLNPRHRLVRSVHADVHDLHRLVMHGFDGQVADGTASVRARLGILFAATRTASTPGRLGPIAGDVSGLIVQSRTEPDWLGLEALGAVVVDDLQQRTRSFAPADTVTVTTWLNPVKSRHATDQAPSTRQHLAGAQAAADWVRRTMTRHGCAIDDTTLRLTRDRALRAPSQSPGFQLILRGFAFTAEITDANAFAYAVAGGVGRGKAYGAGLLCLS